MRGLAMVLLVVLVAGCDALGNAKAFEKGVVEPRVDQAYDEILERLCKMPVDIQRRALDRKTMTVQSLIEICADWRAIRDAMLGEQAREIN